MIEEFKAALVDQIKDAMGAGLDCEGIQTAQAGDAFPATKYHPAVTVDSDGDLSAIDTGNHTDVSLSFLIILYTSSLRGGYQAATAQANNLHLRCAGTGQYRGLHRFLARLKRWQDSAGTNWVITLDPNIDRGAVKDDNAKFASYAIVYRLNLKTMLTKAQY